MVKQHQDIYEPHQRRYHSARQRGSGAAPVDRLVWLNAPPVRRRRGAPKMAPR
jgi:hypothetical protein